jgi:hypothetical protein
MGSTRRSDRQIQGKRSFRYLPEGFGGCGTAFNAVDAVELKALFCRVKAESETQRVSNYWNSGW